MSVLCNTFALGIHNFSIMARKINIFTFLIFVYSVVICVTCKRDFAQDTVKIDDSKSGNVNIVQKNGGSVSQKPTMASAAVVFKKNN